MKGDGIQRVAVFFLGAVMACAPKPAAASGAEVLFRPEDGALPVAYEFVEDKGDGVVFERLVLQGRQMNLGVRLPTDWVVVREPPSRVSFALRHSVRPDLVLTVTRFPSGVFFPDLGEATWNAYKEGLRAIHGETLRIIEEPHNLSQGEGTVILGEPNRAILFRLSGSQGAEMRLKFFLLHRGSPLVFAFSGPEILVEANRSSIELWLSRIAPRD